MPYGWIAPADFAVDAASSDDAYAAAAAVVDAASFPSTSLAAMKNSGVLHQLGTPLGVHALRPTNHYHQYVPPLFSLSPLSFPSSSSLPPPPPPLPFPPLAHLAGVLSVVVDVICGGWRRTTTPPRAV